MFSSDERGYSRPLIDWKNADDKGNITFKHQVSESFLRNYILHYNYRNQNITTNDSYTDASYYLKRYIRGMVDSDYKRTKNNILPVNGYMEIGNSIKERWDRIERIDLKYEIPDTYSDIDNQTLLDYLEVCTIYEEQSQLVCNLILEILADIHKQFSIDEANSWLMFGAEIEGWGDLLENYIKLTFTKWSSEKGHLDWSDGWDEFANLIDVAPEPIHSFVNLVFSIIKLSAFSVLFPPISALALISYSYEMLSMKSFGAKAKSFNLLMQDLLDLYLAKEGYQVKTFDNEIKRHENQSKDGYLQYDTSIGHSNFEFFDYAWKVSPLTFPHKPFEYSNYEIIFGFEQLHDFKNQLDTKGRIMGENPYDKYTQEGGNLTESYDDTFFGAIRDRPEYYPQDILSNKRKYWRHITTQLISLFELIGKRNQKPVLAIPQPDGRVRIYSWSEESLHYNAGKVAPIDGEKDWRWAGYEIKPKSKSYDWAEWPKFTRTKTRAVRRERNAEDDDTTYNTNPEIILKLKHQEIEASQYDLIRYCPNALQAWGKLVPHSQYTTTFQQAGNKLMGQISYSDLDKRIYSEPLLVIGNEYLTEKTEIDNTELLKYLGLLLSHEGGRNTAFIFNDDDSVFNTSKAYTFNRNFLKPDHTHYKLLQMVNLHPNYPSDTKEDKVFSRAIGEDNSILNIPVFDSYWDKEIYFTNSDGRETNPINYNQFRNTLVLDGSIDENNFVFDNDDRFKYSLRKSLEIGRINGGGWGNDWTNIFYPNTTVINVLGRKPAGFINWYVNPTLDVMTQEDYGKSDSTETKQDEPPSKREVKMPIQPHPDDELIVEGDDDDDEAGIREQDYYGYGRGYMAWRRRRNNPDEN